MVSCALNYAGEKVIRYPDIGRIISGFEIPMWSEGLKFVEECSNYIKSVLLVRWDIAIGSRGIFS